MEENKLSGVSETGEWIKRDLRERKEESLGYFYLSSRNKASCWKITSKWFCESIHGSFGMQMRYAAQKKKAKYFLRIFECFTYV